MLHWLPNWVPYAVWHLTAYTTDRDMTLFKSFAWPEIVSASLVTTQCLVTALFWLVLVLVGVYGLHRYWLVFLFYRYRHQLPRPTRRFETLPRITVQLPMFNEGNVAHHRCCVPIRISSRQTSDPSP